MPQMAEPNRSRPASGRSSTSWVTIRCPPLTTLAERFQAKRRATGMTFEEVVAQLQWDPGSLTRELLTLRAYGSSNRRAKVVFDRSITVSDHGRAD